MTNETKIKVRYVETDQMGIVHHSNYFAWFEIGRTEFMKAMGMPYSEVERNGILTPLSECMANFKFGAKYEDELVIRTTISNLTIARIEFSYEVLREVDGKLIATGVTKRGFTNPELRPINVKKKDPEVWNILKEATN